MHRSFGGTIRRLVKYFAFVVALLFDDSLKINLSIQHQTNLNDNFEGQRQNCSTKVLFKVKPARIFHILGRLTGLFQRTLLPLQTKAHGVLLRVDFVSQDRCCYLLSAGGFEINVKV